MDEKNDWWDEISDEQKEAIDKALTEAEEGKLRSHESVIKELLERLKNKSS
ncbi:hypothetical protein [Pinibacter aurantiacus]|uniref:Uncharacterized protein n=1 Tax=Pinibacter aurantiacus TaxID=2851599 RepID=A0A9E2S902_9BACT|nr:hypothetical protein [Pinibacter aurantiacus]MBV4357118.1 hypothetical protein [Pinibacter aurantiacus]